MRHETANRICINTELYLGHKTLCNLWHLLTFRLGQHLSEILTFVLPCLYVICILNRCIWLYHTPPQPQNVFCFFLWKTQIMCLIISHVTDAIGSPCYNQSSLLTAISRASPAMTPGQLRSDFITACMPRFPFPDTPVLLYTSLCCLLMLCYKHPVVS